MTVRRTKRTEKRFNAGLRWIETEVTQLIELYPTNSNKALAVRFGRPVWGITGKARSLGLKKSYAGGYRRQLRTAPVPWSDDEKNLLAELFSTTPNEEIAERIGRSLDAIANKARDMKLRKMDFWSEAEAELLRRSYKELSYEQLAQRLGRSSGATQTRIIVLGLESKVASWTEDEIDFLEKSYLQMTYSQIAQKLGRTCTAVAAKAEKLGFTKHRYWSRADIRKLRQLYAKFTVRQVAEIMGRSYGSVRSRIHLLELHKKADISKKERCSVSESSGDDRGKKSESYLVKTA